MATRSERRLFSGFSGRPRVRFLKLIGFKSGRCKSCEVGAAGWPPTGLHEPSRRLVPAPIGAAQSPAHDRKCITPNTPSRRTHPPVFGPNRPLNRRPARLRRSGWDAGLTPAPRTALQAVFYPTRKQPSNLDIKAGGRCGGARRGRPRDRIVRAFGSGGSSIGCSSNERPENRSDAGPMGTPSRRDPATGATGRYARSTGRIAPSTRTAIEARGEGSPVLTGARCS
jgi:hypothetical protein